MLSFVQSFFTPKASPIGIDFGSETLRLAQVRRVGKDLRLIAAGSADVPSHVRNDPAGRMEFFATSVRELLAQNEFVGRQAVIALPAASMYIQHLRMAKMDEEARRKAILWEARGKLPIDPSQAILRHHVAGEIYQDQEPREEIVLMAAGREMVNQLLSAASRARLDVVGMEVEAKALLDCFAHVYRRKSDAEATYCFVDIGTGATRAIVARGGHILFARSIPIGGDHFNRATAETLNVQLEEARLVRLRIAAAGEGAKETMRQEPVRERVAEPAMENSFALLKASVPVEAERRSAGPSDPQLAIVAAGEKSGDPQTHLVESALREPLGRLVQELDLCRRYYEATFPSHPIDRLVFVGGEAHQRRVCQQIAMDLSLSAQVGDPMVRLGGTCDLAMESALDPTVPQPSWAVALGLTMGAAVNVGQRAVKS